ncbi:MAG: signal peptidase I [Ignavibacteriaceae bacterium]|nr:signal peptidase I [Ignavibacteriaceae bacterium]
MSFKKAVRKLLGIKTEEELNVQKSPMEKTKEFFESLFYALIAALFIITFIVQNTRIPTGSMEGTIKVGDFVLVNKFIYGASSPRFIPFTEIALPYFTLPSFKEPKAGEIVVFDYPGDRDDLFPNELNVQYVKRLIGMPGDTVEIKDKVAFVNGKQFWIPPFIQYLNPRPEPEGRANPNIFPKGKPWNQDNYGPLIIPKKGYTIELDPVTASEWKTTIDREFEEEVVVIQAGNVYIKGEKVTSYTFQKDYYFMMGDNRDDSADSRFWGLVSRDRVVGEAFITLFSWDRDIPFSNIFKLLGSIRPDRILKLLH